MFARVVGEVSYWKQYEYFQGAMSLTSLTLNIDENQIFAWGVGGGMLKEKLSFPYGKLLRLKAAI